MSVLIKGMEMPNNCGACPLRLAWCRERIYMVTRPERCPLVPVPPHGDLIDADALCDGLVSNHPVVIYATGAPIIIPADKEGEG